MKTFSRWFFLGLLMLLSASLVPVLGYSEGINVDYKALCIFSYNDDNMPNQNQLEGIREVFKKANVELDTEYMDTKQFPNEENIDNFYDTLKYKLDNTDNYDGIIVADDAALQFVIDHQQDLFSGIPIYFLGINDSDRAYQASQNPYITGIYDKSTLVRDNIELGMTMIPNAKRIVAVVDGTITGIGDAKQFEAFQADYPDMDFSVISSTDYTYDELAVVLESLDSSSIVILFTINGDKEGYVLDEDEQFKFVSGHTNVPVFITTIGGVGTGLLGGKMVDYHECGKRAASTLLAVFQGASIQEMALDTEVPYYYYFDNNVIKEYNINRDTIPDGAVILNDEINLLEKYRSYIIATGVIMLFLICIAIVLIFDNMKRRQAEKALQTSNGQLMETYQKLSDSEKELKNQYGIVKERAKEMRALYQKYETAIFSTNSVVWALHSDTMEIEISRDFEKVFGKKLPEKEYIHETLKRMTDEESQKNIYLMFQQYLDGRISEINIQIPIWDENNNKRWLMIRGKGLYDLDGKMSEISGIFLDVTLEKSREEYLEYFAKHDFLTDLPNRRDFEKKLQNEIDIGRSGTLLLFDIDDFKSINDTMGHAFGDEILKEIANRLRKMAAGRIYTARMAGDEFLLLFHDVTVKDEIIERVNQLNVVMSESFVIQGGEEYISFSMGITSYPKDNNTINQLLINADMAMHWVKRTGKNNYQFYHEAMKKELKEKREIENILRKAIKENGFELFYQPQVSLESGEINCFEALIRLKGYAISPSQFIPIAEENGDIVEIGRWVAKEAISQMAEWKKQGCGEKTVSINYSAKQMRDKDFLLYLRNLIEEYGISPGNIEIEVTESILMEKTETTIFFLKEIRDSGMSLALDDFGTGYSSLNYLTYIPVDKVKLDKSINDKFLEFENTNVIDSIIALVQSLNLKIIAEGIEEKEQLKKLKSCGCDLVQGYIFSKPISSDEARSIYNRIFEI